MNKHKKGTVKRARQSTARRARQSTARSTPCRTDRANAREVRVEAKRHAGDHRRWWYAARTPELACLPELPRHGYGERPATRHADPWKTVPVPKLDKPAPWLRNGRWEA